MIFEVEDIELFKQKALQWANSFEVACYMDSNQFKNTYSKFDTLIAAGAKDEITAQAGRAFEQLTHFRKKHQGWITGFLGYDLKNELEKLTSSNLDNLHFPDLYFFSPEHLILIKDNCIEISTEHAEPIFAAIMRQHIPHALTPDIPMRPRFSKEEYITAFNHIRQHIIRGEIYVTNFCQEFFAEGVTLDPVTTFSALNQLSPNPFSCFFKHYKQYIICASPERYLAKRGCQLISQPIKGTAKRGKNQQEDEAIKNNLRHNLKEQQENVMVVDMVRNDLTKAARPGTVQTQELFGIYSFQQVHQMISTVVCQLQDGVSPLEAIRSTFPMGSMTGAPKVSAMQLMEQYERSKRGVYSGAIGYLSPDDDFDFNVIIRTLLYNADNGYLSFQVGSAITYDAVAEQEFAECLLKAKAILQVLGQI